MSSLWWGYIHTNNTIQVKRYFDELDIQEAHESPFVKLIITPFKAETRESAIAHIKTCLNNKQTTQ